MYEGKGLAFNQAHQPLYIPRCWWHRLLKSVIMTLIKMYPNQNCRVLTNVVGQSTSRFEVEARARAQRRWAQDVIDEQDPNIGNKFYDMQLWEETTHIGFHLNSITFHITQIVGASSSIPSSSRAPIEPLTTSKGKVVPLACKRGRED